ncbi:MAG: hypothetical protein IKR48_13105 [Kiritimatiellae bacterium]|nr:hypothetical protein [Kiritimatiellia bacterium]
MTILLTSLVLAASWPQPTAEMKPWAYNWWMASAVDQKGLEFQCTEMTDKGFGGFHVIPIYGANGPGNCYRKQWKELLSSDWIETWNLAVRIAHSKGLGIDLTMGAGWCFGGPWIDKEHAASSGMKVKRAGPGGQGYMIDPFSPAAMSNHVARFDAVFGKGGTAERPRAFYHDSYEYYGAVPKHGEDVDESLLACFKVWTDWCHANGYLSRNEAHGAPANWLDFYALADIPETEMFGKDCRDILISKFASSVAHVKGTKLVSAESCTWIDEHFCERPREIKVFLDKLFLAGVNHVFYHGLCYSPVDAQWPGWCFYASLEMNPRNPIWREVAAINAYITRCQSIFQTWTPANDLLVVWDPTSYRKKPGNACKQMSVHNSNWFYGEPIGKTAKRLYAEGFCFDYVSRRQLRELSLSRYAEIIDPEKNEWPKVAKPCPFTAATGIQATRWTKDGQTLFFVVNTSAQEKEIHADKPFTIMDPLSGKISEQTAALIRRNHSLFLIGDGFTVSNAKNEKREEREITGEWTVTPIVGGPEMTAKKTLSSLVGWETWDDAFSGTMRYTITFDASSTTAQTLSLGDVREIAHVRLNGKDLGVCFIPPYQYEIPSGTLKQAGNQLEIEVTNLGANRLRWNDKNGVNWKYFSDINIVGSNYKKFDASTWRPLPSGLLGPVTIW